MAIDLRALPLEVQDYVGQLQSEKEDYKQKYEEHKKLYQDMIKLLFGRKSEKLKLESPDQARLFNEAEASSAKEEEIITTVKAYRRKKKRKEHKPVIPEGLPEVEIKHEVKKEDQLCPCCENSMTKIGEDTSKELNVIPEKLVVHKHIYPKYACSKCKDDSEIISAPRNRFLPGTIVGAGLLAFIIQRKYQFGLPLYRISQMFKTFDTEISRQTMSNWILLAGKKLQDLDELLLKKLTYCW